MKVTEVVRFHGGDCQIVFDLCVDHERKMEVTEGSPVVDFGEPTCWPFCGVGELTPQNDTPIRVATGR